MSSHSILHGAVECLFSFHGHILTNRTMHSYVHHHINTNISMWTRMEVLLYHTYNKALLSGVYVPFYLTSGRLNYSQLCNNKGICANFNKISNLMLILFYSRRCISFLIHLHDFLGHEKGVKKFSRLHVSCVHGILCRSPTMHIGNVIIKV